MTPPLCMATVEASTKVAFVDFVSRTTDAFVAAMLAPDARVDDDANVRVFAGWVGVFLAVLNIHHAPPSVLRTAQIRWLRQCGRARREAS